MKRVAKTTGLLVLLMTSSSALPAIARADDSNFFLRLGPATIMPSEGADITAGGAPVSGGSIRLKNHTTGTIEFGYNFTPKLAISFTGGYPPTIDIYGEGVLAGLGRLGGMTYGPSTLTAQYRFTDFGKFQPYVGAGPLFMFVFDNKDGAMSNVKVKPAIGAAIQVGFDYMVTEKWGVYLDFKKSYLRTKATGSLGGAPVSADVKLDPAVIGAGLTFRF
ncbi:outer membrane protein [Rhizobium sp. RU20A]|uniref:OmpW/AlkL family protein n=1 Tax=Rhizobium sp. RU20A TaxID=1907412 RepID=UPI000956F0A9|nr:OmpW family outer membrane protein [Rhizobium sp. RU20A]SIR32246.1 outer membrane protein [Rhizobium sp. RU20A]